LDLVLDAGTLPVRPPSAVIDTTKDTQVVRPHPSLPADEVILSHSPEETMQYARGLIERNHAQITETGLVLLLEGPLGAGKTHFTHGVAAALGIQEHMQSPTYTLVHEYDQDDTRLIHADLWRLTEATLDELDLRRALQPGTVLVIEWPAPILEELRSIPHEHLFFTEPTRETRELRRYHHKP
jgi:tRNA threonylcarbamoyladenosine biosynthesis protein TsaE